MKENNLDELMETYIEIGEWDKMENTLERVKETYSKYRHYKVIKDFLYEQELNNNKRRLII